jgi:hypothetical protein
MSLGVTDTSLLSWLSVWMGLAQRFSRPKDEHIRESGSFWQQSSYELGFGT